MLNRITNRVTKEKEEKKGMRYTAMGWVGVVSLLAAGCATSLGSRASETEGLKTQVASLESRIEELNQRLEELSQRQVASDTESRPSSTPETQTLASKKGTALSNRQIQTALKSAGFYSGSVDGKLGPQTMQALKEFQRSKGLNPDGVVGSKTSMALAKALENQPGENE